MSLGAQDIQEQVVRVESLLEQLESLQDVQARTVGIEAVQALLELYGEGLARIMERVDQRDAGGLFNDFAADDLIAHLLLLHGLHPLDVETRIRMALEEVRPYLQSHGGGVELLGVSSGVARLRLQGSCEGCPASAMTLKLAIEDAIQKTAPDIEFVEAEGVSDSAPQSTFTPGVLGQDDEQSSSWVTAGGLPQLSNGGLLLKQVVGESVLFLKIEHEYFAYRHICPNCQQSLEQGHLRGAELSCSACGHRYDVRRAGRCLDAPQLFLEPIPLLMGDSGIVKVALPDALTTVTG